MPEPAPKESPPTTAVLAAIQTRDAEIDRLERELIALKKELDTLRALVQKPPYPPAVG